MTGLVRNAAAAGPTPAGRREADPPAAEPIRNTTGHPTNTPPTEPAKASNPNAAVVEPAFRADPK